jgi:thymidine kinase
LSTAPTARAEAGIELICGPMFSGKTTALLARVASEEAAGHKVRNPPFSSTGNDY